MLDATERGDNVLLLKDVRPFAFQETSQKVISLHHRVSDSAPNHVREGVENSEKVDCELADEVVLHPSFTERQQRFTKHTLCDSSATHFGYLDMG
jgi:hypothetical protein